MISFQTIQTTRFSFTLQELTIGQVRELLEISPAYIEKTRTAFLKFALKELEWKGQYAGNTLDDLTAQERLFIETTYLSSTSDTPDFTVSEGYYSDFLQTEKQFNHAVLKMGSIPNDNDIWFIKPLLGNEIEIMEERLLAKEKVVRLDWLVFAMATQLYRENEERPVCKQNPIIFGDWLEQRATTFLKLPESAFNALFSLYFVYSRKLTHFFDISFDQYGLLAFPHHLTRSNEKGEEVELLPARFHPHTTITPIAKGVCGKSAKNDT